jgi:hypothetical protein
MCLRHAFEIPVRAASQNINTNGSTGGQSQMFVNNPSAPNTFPAVSTTNNVFAALNSNSIVNRSFSNSNNLFNGLSSHNGTSNYNIPYVNTVTFSAQQPLPSNEMETEDDGNNNTNNDRPFSNVTAAVNNSPFSNLSATAAWNNSNPNRKRPPPASPSAPSTPAPSTPAPSTPAAAAAPPPSFEYRSDEDPPGSVHDLIRDMLEHEDVPPEEHEAILNDLVFVYEEGKEESNKVLASKKEITKAKEETAKAKEEEHRAIIEARDSNRKNRESVLYARLFSPQRKARLEAAAAAAAAAPSSGKKPRFNNDIVNGSGSNNNNSPFIFNTSNGNENENNVVNDGIRSGTNNNINNGSTFNPNKPGNFAVGYGSTKWRDPTTKFS